MMGRNQTWGLLNQLNREINDLFGEESGAVSSASADWLPRADIKEDREQFVIEVDLPGVAADDIHVDMEEGVLTIQGERRREVPAGARYRGDRAYGQFLRRFSLPDTADGDKISARSQHGVLEIVIPKQKRVQPRRIEVTG